MRVFSLAWSLLWLAETCSFVVLPAIQSRQRVQQFHRLRSSPDGRIPPSPDELKARAAAIREELKELEANASVTRRPNAELAEPKRVRERGRDRSSVRREAGIWQSTYLPFLCVAPKRCCFCGRSQVSPSPPTAFVAATHAFQLSLRGRLWYFPNARRAIA